MTELTSCAHCGVELSTDNQYRYDGELLCDDCYRELTTTCQYCDTVIRRDDDYGSDSIRLCEHCYERHYTRCESCNRIINSDDSYYDECGNRYLCAECDSKLRRSIHSYDYKPCTIFYGSGSRYFGVELEIDRGGEDSDSADRLLGLANSQSEHIYCKHDGSLNDGFEIVTYPLTLEYHMTTMNWDKLLHTAVKMGYESHNAGTCGLHVHVNRESLGGDIVTQEAAIARILYFIETHWIEMLRFSRRTQEQLASWAARYGRKDRPIEILDSANQSYERYRCVNLCNHSTIEFRLFRGTLKLNTLIATLQLVNEICNVAVLCSDHELDDLSWSDFVCNLDIDKYPELITYLKERRLYVNEPVMVGEEI